MADISRNPWTFTPADAGATIWWPSNFFCEAIVWTEQAVVGDRIQLTDRVGGNVMDTRADAVNKLTSLGVNRVINGLKIPIFESGILQVFIK